MGGGVWEECASTGICLCKGWKQGALNNRPPGSMGPEQHGQGWMGAASDSSGGVLGIVLD